VLGAGVGEAELGGAALSAREREKSWSVRRGRAEAPPHVMPNRAPHCSTLSRTTLEWVLERRVAESMRRVALRCLSDRPLAL
jgi:hypothetical protein